MIILSDSTPVAHKTYICNACEWIDNLELWKDTTLTYAELRAIVKARRNQWCIVPGQRYIRQVQIENRQISTFRAIPEMHAICLKYDVYEDI